MLLGLKAVHESSKMLMESIWIFTPLIRFCKQNMWFCTVVYHVYGVVLSVWKSMVYRVARVCGVRDLALVLQGLGSRRVWELGFRVSSCWFRIQGTSISWIWAWEGLDLRIPRPQDTEAPPAAKRTPQPQHCWTVYA